MEILFFVFICASLRHLRRNSFSLLRVSLVSFLMLHLRGIVQSAELVEHPPGGDRVEMALRLQGVGPGQPRRIVVPFEMLVQNPDLDEESIAGHAFEADVEEDPAGSKGWAGRLSFAARRILRKDPANTRSARPGPDTGSPGWLATASESVRPTVISG